MADTAAALSLSNSLADLAARIKIEHAATATAMRRGVEHAMAAGDLLLEAKAQIRHGEWLPWLEAHCQIPERTARLYMRIARNRAELKIGNVADLTVRGAVALLASPADSFASLAADSELENLEIAAFERAEAEIAIRHGANCDAQAALKQIIGAGENSAAVETAALAVWDQLGEQLTAAIGRLNDDPAAILEARDIAIEMARRVRGGGAIAEGES